MYSKPSNSDWSILFMTSLEAQRRGGWGAGCLLPWVLLRPPCQTHGRKGGREGAEREAAGALHLHSAAQEGVLTPGLPQHLLIIWGQLHGLAGELRVEIVQAVVISDLRLEGRQGLLLL